MTDSKQSFLDYDVAKAFSGFGIPNLNVEPLIASHRKNVEAVISANRLIFEGVQGFARRQFEIARETFEEVPNWFRDLSQGGAPEDRLAKNVELGKASLEKGLSAARELGELVAKSNAEAFDVITKRMSDCLAEIRDVAGRKAA